MSKQTHTVFQVGINMYMMGCLRCCCVVCHLCCLIAFLLSSFGVWRLWWFNYPGLLLHAELESACLSELNEDRLCIALLDRLLCVV